MTIYNLDVLLFLFGTSLLFHVQFCLTVDSWPALKKDVVKIALVNRYGGNNITNGFIKGFNLKKGAFGASVSHDSHNILVIGTNSEDMAKVVNIIRERQGGLVAYSSEEDVCEVLELPIAGLMSNKDIDVSNFISSFLWGRRPKKINFKILS